MAKANPELVTTYREQLIAVSNNIANRICGDAGNETVNALVAALLEIHTRVLAYDSIMIGDNADGRDGSLHGQ